MSTIKISSVSSVSIHKLAIAFLWLVLVIAGMLFGPAFTKDTLAYGADNQADCVALGGAWEPPSASNQGRGGCSGEGPCKQSGGVWTASTRLCTYVSKTFSNDTIANKIKAYNYYVALSSDQCNFGGSISGADIGNYVWLLGSNPHLAQASRGSLDCNQRDGKDGKWLKDAISLFNIPGGDPGEQLCALGMTQVSVTSEALRTTCGKNASTGSNKFEWKGVESKRASVLSTIRKWYFNNQDPVFSDAMTYHVALQDFFDGQICAAATSPQASYGDSTTGSKKFNISLVENNQVVQKEFTVTGDNQYKVSELYNISALDGSRYVVANVPCADYMANANSAGNLPTVGQILSDRKYAVAYQDYIEANAADDSLIKDPEAATTPTDDDTRPSCAVEGVGWIVCPVLTFLGDITDKAYTYIGNNFLQIDNGLVAAGSSTNKAWGYMRNLANVVFVIVFLFIIFSQLTGQGITNYGVKKMLPRLVVAAILVNVSFFICQVAVDLSNILGVSLKSLLESVGAGISPDQMGTDQSTNWGGIVIAVLSGAGITWALGLPVLIPFLLAAVIAVLMTFMILVLRQVLIVMLVVLAPIAFVAFILPNTEQWFTKWRKMFVGLLLVFPTIGLLFGAASLASGILKTVYGTGSGNPDTIGLIIAHGVLVLPLFLLPGLLKKSLDAVGNIGAKINGFGDKVGRGSRSKVAGSGVMKSLSNRRARTRAQIGAGIYSGSNPISSRRSKLNARLNQSDLYNKVTGDYGTIRGANIERLEGEETKLAEAAVELRARDPSSPVEIQLADAIRKGDVTRAVAAQNILMRKGGPGVNEVRKVLGQNMSSEMKTILANNIMENHAQAAKQKSNDVLQWAVKGGSTSIAEVSSSANTWGKLTANELAGQTDDAFKAALISGAVSQTTLQTLQSERLMGDVNDVKRNFMAQHLSGTLASTAGNGGSGAPSQTQQQGVQDAQRAAAQAGSVRNLQDGDTLPVRDPSSDTQSPQPSQNPPAGLDSNGRSPQTPNSDAGDN